jgi:hypothetical protein
MSASVANGLSKFSSKKFGLEGSDANSAAR